MWNGLLAFGFWQLHKMLKAQASVKAANGQLPAASSQSLNL
jgi:hypothetical protein